MGAEGKYDLKLAAPMSDASAASAAQLLGQVNLALSSSPAIKVDTITTNSTTAKGGVPCSAFANRKSSSTSSLVEPSSSGQPTVACTDQASSDDNLVVRKAGHAVVENVLTRTRADSALADQSMEGVMSVGLSPTQEETEESLAESERPALATPKSTLDELDEHRSSSSASAAKAVLEAGNSRSNANVSAMSVSVPNLSLSNNVNDSMVTLMDNLTARRGQRGNSNASHANASNATNTGSSLLSQGQNNVCSLVRLALSPNFPEILADLLEEMSVNGDPAAVSSNCTALLQGNCEMCILID